MSKIKWLFMIFALCCGSSQAMDGVFDRTAEINHYIEQLSTDLTHEEYIEIAKSIYAAGIEDDRLAQAIGDRLLKDIRDLDDFRTASQYGVWMVKAMASTSTTTAGNFITRISKLTAVAAIQGECKDALRHMDWYHRKNQIMASRANYSEGDDMRISQLLNLLKDYDPTYKHEATYQMNIHKILDVRLTDEIARQLQDFVDRDGISLNRSEYATMNHYIKLLAYSGNDKYRAVLVAVTGTKAPQYGIRAEARSAIRSLDKR